MIVRGMLAVLVLAGCASRATTSPPVVATSAATMPSVRDVTVDAGAPSPARPASPGACARLLALHRAAWSSYTVAPTVVRDADAPDPPDADPGRVVRPSCLEDANGGAWGLILAPQGAETPPGTQQWQAVFTTADGAIGRFDLDAYGDPDGPAHTRFSVALHALDGEGPQELFVRVSEHTDPTAQGDAPSFMARTLRAAVRDGHVTIAPYPQDIGSTIVRWEDVDHDGRLDGIVYEPFEQSGGVGFVDEVHGPALALHALADGSYARSDAAVMAYVRAQCEAAEPRLALLTLTPVNVACARMRGLTREVLRAEVQRRCGRRPRRCPVNDTATLDQMDRFAQTQPPFLLP